MPENEVDGEKIAENVHFPECEKRNCSIVAAQYGVFFSGTILAGKQPRCRGVEWRGEVPDAPAYWKGLLT
jgi:hypothetical protein